MAIETKKFLDQQGVSTLWSKVVSKINETVTAEETRALAAEKVNADAIAAIKSDYLKAADKTELSNAIAAEAARADAAEKANATAISNLNTKVGDLPQGTDATSVIDYVDKKTTGIATEGAMTALDNRVKAIEDDYLVEADIANMATDSEVEAAVNVEKERAMAEEKRLAGLIANIDFVDDEELAAALNPYAKTADVAATYETIANADLIRGRLDELEAHDEDYKAYADQAELDAVATAKAYTDEVKANILGEGITETFDTLVEIKNWIEGDGVNATELTEAIAAEAKTRGEEITRVEGLVTAETNRADAAEKALAGRLDILEAIDHDAYVAADAALKTELSGEIAKKANTTALEAAIEALEGADAGLAERLDSVESVLTGGEGSVAEQIEAAKEEAIATAADDATAKDIVVLAESQKYTDAEIDKVEGTITTLQGVVDGKAAQSDLTALTTRVTTAEGEIDTLQTEMDAVEALAAENKAAITAIKDHGTVDSFADVMAEIAKKQDSFAENKYDVNGSAAQALVDAKAYTDAEVAKIQSLSTAEIEAAIAAAMATA